MNDDKVGRDVYDRLRTDFALLEEAHENVVASNRALLAEVAELKDRVAHGEDAYTESTARLQAEVNTLSVKLEAEKNRNEYLGDENYKQRRQIDALLAALVRAEDK